MNAQAAARRPPASTPPSPVVHTRTITIPDRHATLPRRAVVSIIGTANIITAILVGLIPTVPPFPTAARDTKPHIAGYTTDAPRHAPRDAPRDAAEATSPPRSAEEQRRILHLEQTIRTRALIDDMVNSLE